MDKYKTETQFIKYVQDELYGEGRRLDRLLNPPTLVTNEHEQEMRVLTDCKTVNVWFMNMLQKRIDFIAITK